MSFGRLKIAPLILGFLKKYPQVEIDMVMDDRYSDIVVVGFDVAIRGGNLADSSLIARKLMLSRSLICASKTYLDGRFLPKTPIDLTEHNALIYSQSGQMIEWIFEYNDYIERVSVRGNYRVNNSEAILAGCLQGLGVGRLPDFIAKSYINSAELIQLLPGYNMPEKSIWAVFPERAYMPVKVRVFTDYLSDTLTL
ncbi:substrate binding domain-containing protein [Vibrio sp. DW001]|uniref:substrate binding domain-containing protein n=1 Tax=Vibrio sp. DW001 TaxID=2912315 RepID=UPI0023B0BC5C|nr:substrate binding domain-containing protein [Vibrio sp. DW001]WED25598.1 substrate binding domain-containing protein [Vibrio sp. DW001]